MKKTITILAAVMLVFSFAGLASALDAINCPGEAGYINVCDEQKVCKFDFEWLSSYCEDSKITNRGVFPICKCDSDFIANLKVNTTYQVGMKILVDKGNGPVEGNNGVYWAEDVNRYGIAMETYGTEGLACADDGYESEFAGPFDYYAYLASTPGTVNEGLACVAVDEGQEIVEIRASADAVGYKIIADDIIGQNSNWAINIPSMRVELSRIESNWDVYVEVCIQESISESGTICSDCGECCFMLKIGTLCCPDDDAATGRTLVYPYFGKTDGAWWNGVAVTNLTSEAGTANVTVYENGDVWTGPVAVPANGPTFIDASGLTLTTEGGDGIYGNEQSYMRVVTDFDASGFAMMAKESNGVSMGYLPIIGQ